MTCEGCGTETHHAVCMGCVQARAKAAFTKRCGCGKQKRPTEVLGRPGQRQWIGCRRCLGTIKQVA